MSTLKINQTYVRVTVTMDVLVANEDDAQSLGGFIGVVQDLPGEYNLPYTRNVKIKTKQIDTTATVSLHDPNIVSDFDDVV